MKLYKRENYLKRIRGFYDATDIIKVLTGVRRCGKSSLMLTIVDELIAKGGSAENIIYLDLDRREYRKVTDDDQLERLIEEKSKGIEGIKYLFIDEVQNVRNFELVLNGFRMEEEYSIFITGSNSYLLSGELSTKLTGRYVEFEIFTLNFEEYQNMKKFFGKPINTNPLQELNSFILEGGFPRAVQFDDLEDKRSYTLGVIKEIFEKDIRRRLKIRDRDAFEIVRNFIINNYGSLISINGIVDNLKKHGNSISKATVSRYIQALLDAKIIYECTKFDMKSKKMIKGEADNMEHLLDRDVERVLFSEEELRRRVAEIAAEIDRDYAGKEPLLVSVLRGSFVFMADLVRQIHLPCTVDFMAVSSYGSGTSSSGQVKIVKDLSEHIEGRDLIVVEDILDSGNTLSYLLQLLQARRPASVRLCTLLDKPSRRTKPVELHYSGFTIPDYFVVGYGLDYDEKYRNLPYIGVLKPSVYGGE